MVGAESNINAWAKHVDPEDLNTQSEQERLESIQRLLRGYNETMTENESLRRDRRTATNNTTSTSSDTPSDHSSSSSPRWIRAEADSPTASNDVVVFNSATRHLEVKGADDLGGVNAVYSRLPSRLPKTLQVWSESISPSSATPARAGSPPQSAAPTWRVTDKAGQKHNQQDGLLYHGSIHLRRLDVADQMRILMGRIRYIFIVKPDREQQITSPAVAVC